MLKRLCSLISTLAAVACFANVQEGLAPERKSLLLDSFEKVWTTVRDQHYDPALGGLDWQSVYEQYRPRVEGAASEQEGRDILNEMLGLLKQTHIGVISNSAYSDLQGESRGDFEPGIELRILDGKAIVTHVAAGSPAADAGVAKGWEILRVGERPVAPVIERVKEHYLASTQKDLMGSRAIMGLISGQPSEPVEIEFHDGAETKTIQLDRAEPRGDKVTFGDMPSQYFWVETDSTADGIRVIRFNIWFNPEAVANAFSKIMADAETAKGFIIDLRGNPGGIGGMSMGAAGWFFDRQGLKLGTMMMRGATINFIVFSRPNATNAPLAILVDGLSASTSEIFAGGMQDLKRARIFGTQTAGSALPSTFIRLPNGDGFQYIVANYISEGGQPLEGLGVKPDETVRPTQSELLAGKDPALDRAIAWIKSH